MVEITPQRNLRLSNTKPTKKSNELRCPGRINNSSSKGGASRVILVANQVISHE
jgi:hypothetical protein